MASRVARSRFEGKQRYQAVTTKSSFASWTAERNDLDMPFSFEALAAYLSRRREAGVEETKEGGASRNGKTSKSSTITKPSVY